ncbi:MAG: DUF1501 domain-containing protein [Ideonella sp.]
MLRRKLLKSAAWAGVGLMPALLPIGRTAWAAVGAAPQTPARRLVVIFLRGAVDGLNVVVPYADAGYYSARSTIALAPPGDATGVIDLDGRFGLHPALAPLVPMWKSGTLGFVQACGSNDPTRSHFDAQDYMESATPGRKSTPDGWMNRLLGTLADDTPTRAISVGPVLPRIYAGPNRVASIAVGAAADRPVAVERPRIAAAFGQLYDGDDKMSQAYRDALKAKREVRRALDPAAGASLSAEMMAANNGAPLPNGFPNDAARLAKLMRNDSRVQLAFMALGGWDTHAGQGAATGQLANRLQPLGAGLAALAAGLGPVFDQTMVVVMSEFGRTARQNGNGGTDHGHGNVMWLLGGQFAGGRVLGQWPGLAADSLHEGRDLAVTTDFRDVLSAVARQHLGLSQAQTATVFPDYAATRSIELMRA